MKRSNLFWILFLLVFTFSANAQSEYVNPLVGTAEHGHTFPGALVPFGGVQVSPDTRLEGWDGCSGYHYSDNRIYGFSHTHLSGTGCSDYGDILVMPFTGTPSVRNSEYSCTFTHNNEKATAGYYAVKLDNGIFAELTASQRVGVHRYTFPKEATSKGIVIDLSHRDLTLISSMTYDGTQIYGFRRSEAWNPDQHCNFSLLSSQPFQKIEFYRDDKLVKENDVRGGNCKAIVYFDKNVTSVVLKVAISAVDIQGAIQNQKEFSNYDFDLIRNQAKEAWNRELGRIKVETKDKERLKVFYTALYHSFTSPYLYTDIDGRYRGMDGRIQIVEQGKQVYTVFSLWDTYRALHPLLNIIDQKRTEDFLYTFLQHYRQGGMLPVWELSAFETWCMIGYHSIPVILDAYVKGIHPYDEKEMLQAMVHSATLDKFGRKEYAMYGYVPGDADNESVSKTLEYAYDDWCIARFAELTGNQKVADEFYRRSQSYRNILDPDGFMHGKRNGGFVTPFNPTEVNNYYTEANSWQYSTYVPHDMPYYISMMGGQTRMESFLDRLFTSSSVMTGREQSDITGVIGQYAHGNEPSHHAAYLYNYVGRHDKTAEMVRKIMTELYTSQPDGLCGNEDCGQMSAWYVLSSLGFYPVCPGNNRYSIGYPMFDKATVQLENGKQFIVRKEGKGDYIARVTVNGRTVSGSPMEITFDDIKNGGELVFTMTKEKVVPQVAPESPILVQPPIMPYFSTDKERFSGTTSIEIKLYRPEGYAPVYDKEGLASTVIYYTLDGSDPAPTHGLRYTGPITLDKTTTVKAVAYNPNQGVSRMAQATYVQYAKDKVLTYITRPQDQYFYGGQDGLIDDERGKLNYRIGGWQGFLEDAKILIDLKQSKPVTEVTVGCLEEVRAWIFYPKKVNVYISDDGEHYTLFGTANGIGSIKEDVPKKHDFVVKGNATGRYVKVEVENYGKLPDWHISAGQQSWLFIDEIIVK